MLYMINKLSKKIVPASALVLFLASCMLHAPDDPPATVSRVDLPRYLGKWYEIAHIPNRFQRNCSHGTTAEYRQTGTGRIAVLNSCIRTNGSVDQAAGIARVVDTDTNARLQVSFVQLLGLHLFWGDYWILGIDSGYNYAFVGDPGRKYGWVLSRKPELGAVVMARIWEMVQQQGYNPDDFSLTAQEAGQVKRTSDRQAVTVTAGVTCLDRIMCVGARAGFVQVNRKPGGNSIHCQYKDSS